MKITLPNEKIKFLANIMLLADQTVPDSIELDVDWRVWVAAPIALHAITPREARTILTTVGILADYKVPINKIIEKILECFVENYNKPSGGVSHD